MAAVTKNNKKIKCLNSETLQSDHASCEILATVGAVVLGKKLINFRHRNLGKISIVSRK